MKKVITIGGPPMAGKSTIAVKLASRLEYACVSTDDIGEAIRAKIKTRELNPFAGRDYREYYISTSIDQLIDDTKIQHHETWAGVRSVITAHANWGTPLVIEGWCMYPEWIAALQLENTASFWLCADRSLLESRLDKSPQFWQGTSDKARLFRHFISRSEWHSRLIREQAQELGHTVYEIDSETNADDICAKVLAEINTADKG